VSSAPRPENAVALTIAAGASATTQRLQRRREQPDDVEPRPTQPGMQRLDRVEIGSGQVGAIEDQQDPRPRRGHRERRRARHPVARLPATDLGNRLHPRDRPGIEPRRQRHLRQRRLRRDRAAIVTQGGEPAQRRHRHRRRRIEPRIDPPVRGQHRQRDPPRPRQRLDLLQPIGPVGPPADQPDHDPLRAFTPRQRSLDIGIDRQRMRERGQIGEPQRRQRAPVRRRTPPPGRERAEIPVRKGQDDKIRRALRQILRDRALLQPVAFAKDDVHRRQP
jgi:hypothetical protein